MEVVEAPDGATRVDGRIGGDRVSGRQAYIVEVIEAAPCSR